jgi:hypothetical protein
MGSGIFFVDNETALGNLKYIPSRVDVLEVYQYEVSMAGIRDEHR